MAKDFSSPLKSNRYNAMVLSVFFDAGEKEKLRNVKRRIEVFRVADFKSDVKFIKWAAVEAAAEWLEFRVKKEIGKG